MGFANLLIMQLDERQCYSILQVTYLSLSNLDEKPKYVLSLIHFFDLNAELQFLYNTIKFSPYCQFDYIAR